MVPFDPGTARVISVCVTVLAAIWMLRRRKYVTLRAWPFSLYFGDQPPPDPPKKQ